MKKIFALALSVVFAAGLALVVGELRSAPLERPLTISFEPGRRHVRALRMHGTVAAAAVALAAASIVLGRVHLGATSTAPPATTTARAAVSTVRDEAVKRQLFALLPPSDRWRAEFQGYAIPPL